jgi:hypothetical protein
MEKFESLCSILSRLNLNDIEHVVQKAYHRDGSGSPLRKPMGVFKALMIKRSFRFASGHHVFVARTN